MNDNLMDKLTKIGLTIILGVGVYLMVLIAALGTVAAWQAVLS